MQSLMGAIKTTFEHNHVINRVLSANVVGFKFQLSEKLSNLLRLFSCFGNACSILLKNPFQEVAAFCCLLQSKWKGKYVLFPRCE